MFPLVLNVSFLYTSYSMLYTNHTKKKVIYTAINATFTSNLMCWYCGVVKMLQVCLIPIFLADVGLNSYSS